MSYTVEDLNPSKPILDLGTKKVELSLITLQKEVIYKEEYGSLQKAFESFGEDAMEIFNIIWILVADKHQFKNSLEVFKSEILSITSQLSLVEVSGRMNKALNEAVSKSMPVIKNRKRYEEIQEIKGKEENAKPCYGTYFDTIAKRYGYTLEQFYELTLGQLHILLKVIGDKQYEELEIQAALQGKKLKPRIKFDDISEEEEKDQDNQAMDALRRLQEEYKKKQAQKG